MKNKLAATLLLAAAALLPGCHTAHAPSATTRSADHPPLPTTNPAGSEVIARVGDVTVTRRELESPLLEAYGLPMLLNIIQLDLAREQVRLRNMKVTPQDIHDERTHTLATMFADAPPSDYETLLDQLLNQRRVSRADFELTMETNANFRKLAEPQVPGMITDTMVHQAFGELYGENRQVRDIELANLREVAEAKRRLAAGEPFDKVAREMSQDTQTRALGGELPPFSSQNPNISPVIKDAAFHLQIGEVSDPLQDGDAYHLILLVNVIPPKIVKFDDVKDIVRKELEDTLMTSSIQDLRMKFGRLAMQTLQIDDPILKQKWQEMVDQSNARQRDRDEIRSELSHNRPATAAATEPATPPAGPPATQP